MREKIAGILDSIERDEGVRVLYAAESGSRAWGFASADSDWDVRFIYIRRPEWYLAVERRPDYIELPVDAMLDVNGWDLKKALLLLKKSNPTLSEWLCSPIVYTERGRAAERLRSIQSLFFSPVHATYHYLYTAVSKHRECTGAERIKLKKYFYMLRPLLACMWIEKYGESPPMEFSALLAGQELDAGLRERIGALLERKAASTEDCAEPPDPLLMGFIGERISHFEQAAKALKSAPARGYDELNELFRATLEETWR